MHEDPDKDNADAMILIAKIYASWRDECDNIDSEDGKLAARLMNMIGVVLGRYYDQDIKRDIETIEEYLLPYGN